MGRSSAVAGGAVILAAALAGGRAGAYPTTTSTTTTTTRPRPPGVFVPAVSPDSIENRSGCGGPTSATVSTGTTGKADRVTFRVELGGRLTTLYGQGSGRRWSATLSGSAFGSDHGAGSVRAVATGPGGTSESGPTGFSIDDCPA